MKLCGDNADIMGYYIYVDIIYIYIDIIYMYITKQINVPKTSHLEKSLVVTVFLPGSLFFSAMDV